jgi:hypothetical protein
LPKAQRPQPITDRPFAPPDWPALARENRMVAVLKPHPRNARTHPPEQIAAMVAGIKEFGIYKVSVLIDEGDTILAGHGMIAACAAAGVEEVPVAVARGWTEKKKLACVEADNRYAELGTWNEQLRIENLQSLQASGFALDLIGWSAEPLAAFLNGWASDIDPRERFGANLDGIPGKIVVTVDPADIDAARGIIDRALTRAKIEHEL